MLYVIKTFHIFNICFDFYQTLHAQTFLGQGYLYLYKLECLIP